MTTKTPTLREAAQVESTPAATRAREIDPNESDPRVLWTEIARLNDAVQGPIGYATWQDAATDERIRRVRAEKALAAAQPPQAPPAAPSAEQGEAMAWLVYLPSQQTQHVYDDQDDPDMVDDLTNNDDAEVTPLFVTQPAAPVGWVLVPVEPTIQQMAAMGPAIRASVGLDGKTGNVVDVYRAALAASPKTGGANG